MPEYADVAAFSLLHPERPGLIVGLHGLTGTRAQPLRYLEDSDSPEFGTLAPDLRGHGDTEFLGRPEDFGPVQLADDVTALLRRLGLASRPICLMGVSLGATVALQLLRDATLEVCGAVFVRPAHSAVPPPHLRVNALIASYLLEDPSTALARLIATDEYEAAAAASERAALSLREKVTKPRSAERLMRLDRGAFWMAFSAGEKVERNVPSLILAASQDPLHPVAVAEEWHSRISGSSLVTLPSVDEDPAGHWALARSSIAQFVAQKAAPMVEHR